MGGEGDRREGLLPELGLALSSLIHTARMLLEEAAHSIILSKLAADRIALGLSGLSQKTKRQQQLAAAGALSAVPSANQKPASSSYRQSPSHHTAEHQASAQSASSPQLLSASARHESPSGALAALASAASAAAASQHASPSTSAAPKLGSDIEPVGSCPGGGVCNGQGGKSCCQGCPAFNNRVLYAGGKGAKAGEGGDDDGDGGMQCFNCETSKYSGPWRWMVPRSEQVLIKVRSFRCAQEQLRCGAATGKGE